MDTGGECEQIVGTRAGAPKTRLKLWKDELRFDRPLKSAINQSLKYFEKTERRAMRRTLLPSALRGRIKYESRQRAGKRP